MTIMGELCCKTKAARLGHLVGRPPGTEQCTVQKIIVVVVVVVIVTVTVIVTVVIVIIIIIIIHKHKAAGKKIEAKQRLLVVLVILLNDVDQGGVTSMTARTPYKSNRSQKTK